MNFDNYILQIKQSFRSYQTRQRMKKYGLSAIQVFSELATINKWDYSLGFGSLLGAYREKGFIKNDDDIDVIVNRVHMGPDLIRQMENAGFVLNGVYLSSDKELMHFSFTFKGIIFDLYGFNVNYHGGDSIIFVPNPPIGSDWVESEKNNIYQVYRVHFNYRGTENVYFQGVKVKILVNAKEFLSAIYGDDFMTPLKKKGFKSPNYELVSLDEMEAHRVRIEDIK